MKMKRKLLILFLWMMPGLSFSQVDTLYYSVVKGGTICGVQKRWLTGNEHHYFFQFNDRGRGDSLYDDVSTDAKGWIIKSTTHGNDYYKQPYAASFQREGDSLVSTTNGIRKSKIVQRELYVGMQAPGSIELLINAALAEPLHRIPMLNGDTFEVRTLHQKQYSVKGSSMMLYLAETYYGNNTPPVFYWLDAQKIFFASVSEWFSTVRKNYENLADTLNTVQDQQSLSYYTGQMQSLSEKLSPRIAIEHVRLYDAEKAQMLEDMTILIDDGKIAGVKSADNMKIPSDYILINGRNKTLMPGLWDMHGHYDKGEGLSYLAGGVTHVRDMGNGKSILAVRDAIRKNEILGPDISFVSGFIDKAGPFQGPTGAIISSLDEGLSAVREFSEKGYGQIKLYSSIEPAWVKPLAEAAHAKGMRVAGHIPAYMTATSAVQAGYDEITHMNMVMLNFMGDTIDTRTPKRFSMVGEYSMRIDVNGKEMNQFVGLLKEKKIVVDPTMHIFYSLFMVHPGDTDAAYKPLMSWMPAATRENVKATTGFVPEGKNEMYAASYQMMLHTLKKLYDNNIMIVCGTDGGEAIALHHELELYVEAGIPPLKALQTATWNASVDCSLTDRYGKIAPGKEADLILIDGDPGKNISDIRKVEWVMKNNVMYNPKVLLSSIGWSYYY